ncbi:MAG: type II toxin-antitoxin system VapC family toxin [Opitutales bacterium]
MRSRDTALIGIDTPFLIAHTVIEHPEHKRALKCCTRLLDTNHNFAICPTVVDEFLHVVTDPKRFQSPLSMSRALERARAWINSQETRLCYPTEDSQRRQLDWMAEHRIGRKRINDTRIASIYYTHQVTRLLTANVRDYTVFGVFEIVDMDF